MGVPSGGWARAAACCVASYCHHSKDVIGHARDRKRRIFDMGGIVREARTVRGPSSDVRFETLKDVDSSPEFSQLLSGLGGENLQEIKQLANASNQSTRTERLHKRRQNVYTRDDQNAYLRGNSYHRKQLAGLHRRSSMPITWHNEHKRDAVY